MDNYTLAFWIIAGLLVLANFVFERYFHND